MPARLPTTLAAAVSRCSSIFAGSTAPRVAVASLHSSARLAAPPRTPPSSGASFLNLDSNETGRPRPGSAAPGSQAAPTGTGQQAPQRYGPRSDANAALSRVLFDSETRRRMHERREEQKRTALEKMTERKTTDDYARHLHRKFNTGEIYSPRDLNPVQQSDWSDPWVLEMDTVDLVGINPLDEYRNFSMISEYVTSMGRIRHSSDTMLRPVNQRRMARAIRRSIGMGFHPSTHKHPEILAMTQAARPAYSPSGGSRGRR
ncbi:hypothetical protein Sste5346_002373 [Sporothrix stenoceras]|uniref:Small ribosomal subunit protein bS18m n=1 Tax=Sporothrix stenoceras TaxID=5173 RepID=A0ABR3ZIX1_9PEZI